MSLFFFLIKKNVGRICFRAVDLVSLLKIFYDSFDETFEGRWVVSEKEDYKGACPISFCDLTISVCDGDDVDLGLFELFNFVPNMRSEFSFFLSACFHMVRVLLY